MRVPAHSEVALTRRVAAEFAGTAMLLTAIVGSGIMGERLAAGNVAIALLANSLATGAALVAILLTFADVSGGHLNPVVTLSHVSQQPRSWGEAASYVAAQLVGAMAGVLTAHAMFGLPVVSISQNSRSDSGEVFSEFVATFGLLTIIRVCSVNRPRAVPAAVAAYVTAAYWFTASTSFANPAVTLARAVTDTFAGIRPVDVPSFVFAQLLGGAAATVFCRWLVPHLRACHDTGVATRDVEN